MSNNEAERKLNEAKHKSAIASTEKTKELKEKLSELNEMIDTDLKIDVNNLIEASTATSRLHSKYLALLSEYRLKAIECECRYDMALQERIRYYAGKDSSTKCQMILTSAEAKLYAEADKDIIALRILSESTVAVLDVIKRTLESLKQRGYDIKNIIDWKKFEAGY